MQTQVQVQSFNVQQTPAQEGPESRRMKKILRGLGITEAIIGLICCVMGILLMANVYGQPNYSYYSNYYYTGYSSSTSGYRTSLRRVYLFNLGEGLWAGIWDYMAYTVVPWYACLHNYHRSIAKMSTNTALILPEPIFVAGVLGAACGKKTVTPCLINAYLAFSIVACFFAITMFGINAAFAAIYGSRYQNYPFGVGVEATLALFSFTAFIICIVSACYCCCAFTVITNSPSCCGSCCGSGIQPNGGYVVSNVGTSAGMQPVGQGTLGHFRGPQLVQGQTNFQPGATMYVNQPTTMTTLQHPQVAVQQASPSHGVAQQSGQGAGSQYGQENQDPPLYQNKSEF